MAVMMGEHTAQMRAQMLRTDERRPVGAMDESDKGRASPPRHIAEGRAERDRNSTDAKIRQAGMYTDTKLMG